MTKTKGRTSLRDVLTPEVMADRLKKNMTREAIANEFGASKQRINQLYKEYKGLYPELNDIQPSTKESLRYRLTPQVMADMFNPPKNMSLVAIAQHFGVSKQRVHQLFNEYKEEYPGLLNTEPPTKEAVEELLDKGYSIMGLAKAFNMDHRTMKKLMDSYGLQKIQLKDKLTKEVLTELSVNQGLSDQKIADMYGCAKITVEVLRRQYNIQYVSLADRLTKSVFEELYIERGLMLSDIANLFSCSAISVGNIKQDYGIPMQRNGQKDEKVLEGIKKDLIRRGIIRG